MKRERGSMTMLGIGVCLVALLLIVIAIDTTALQVQRTRLWNLADAAALTAADALDRGRYFDRGMPEPERGLWLDDDELTKRAERLIETDRAPRDLQIRLVRAESPDGRSARVTLAARVHLPITGPLLASWGSGIDLSVTGHARSRG